MSLAQGAHNIGQTTSATSVTTAALATTTGSGVVVLVTWSNSQTFTSITDSVGNPSPTQIGTELSDAANMLSRLYYYPLITGNAAHTFTLTISGATACSIWAVECTTTNGVGILLDQTNQGLDNVGTNYDSPSITTTIANEFLFGGAVERSTLFSGTIIHNPGNGFTLTDEITNAGFYWTGYSSTQVVSATGTYNTSWTNSGTEVITTSSNWIASFSEAGIAAPTPHAVLYGMRVPQLI